MVRPGRHFDDVESVRCVERGLDRGEHGRHPKALGHSGARSSARGDASANELAGFVQECDGADVTSVPLPGFPGGMFVTQDGYDDDRFGPDGTTNMKFTPWASVAGALPAKLLAKSRYDPRRP